MFRPFILGTFEGKWKPTIAHFFVELLHTNGLLQRLYTQNIDGLDNQLSIDENKIVYVHGSLAQIRCEFCKANYPSDRFKDEVQSNIRNIYDLNDTIAPEKSCHINCLKCNKPGVKPSTVLYGTDLPQRFFECVSNDFPNNIDLLIIAGTSLTVHPTCNFVNKSNIKTPRILINKEKVGEELGLDFDNNENDFFLRGDCDNGFLHIAEQLGLITDLYNMRDRMCENSQLFFDIYYRRYMKGKSASLVL